MATFEYKIRLVHFRFNNYFISRALFLEYDVKVLLPDNVNLQFIPLENLYFNRNPFMKTAVVAEWLRRLTRNQIPSGSAGSNPADCELSFAKLDGKF